MSDATFTGGAAGIGSGQPDLAWGARIPLLNNRFIWWDFAKIIVISVAGMWVAVLVASLLIDASNPILLPWQLPVVCGAIVGVCFPIACLVMGNGYSARFLVDSEGVHWDSGSKEKTRSCSRNTPPGRSIAAICCRANAFQKSGRWCSTLRI